VTTPEALRQLINALEGLQIPYMLVGALSVNQYARHVRRMMPMW